MVMRWAEHTSTVVIDIVMRGFVALASVTLLVGVAAVVNDMDRDSILDRYTATGSYMCWWWAPGNGKQWLHTADSTGTVSRQTRWRA